MLKNIVFDLGNVIATFDPHEIYYRFTNSEKEAMELYQYLYESGLWWALDRGVDLEDVIDGMKKNSPEHYHHAIERIIHEWIDVLEIDKNMVQYIEFLKSKGFNIYLLSNISKQFYSFKEKNPVFELFDGIYVSADSQLIKPDHEVYHDFINKFKLDPNESIFIDDRLENVEGASECGFHIYHYQNDLVELKDHINSLLSK